MLAAEKDASVCCLFGVYVLMDVVVVSTKGDCDYVLLCHWRKK